MAKDRSDFPSTPEPLEPSVLRMLEQVRVPICVTDPNQTDNPIVYVNSAFLDLTGYTEAEVLNRNCRFLQGPDTTAESIAAVRKAIVDNVRTTIEIVNYRKDGSSFLNALQIGPIQNPEGETILFFGSQLDVTEKRAEEERKLAAEMEERAHRLRNIVNVMTIAVRVTAKEALSVVDFAKTVTERLDLLGRAHFSTFERATTMPLRDLVETVLHAYAPHGARQARVEGAGIELSPSQLTPLTLALHELAANAVKHGALGTDEGHVEVVWTDPRPDGRFELTWQEIGGPKVATPDRENGSRIIRDLIERSGGTLVPDWRPEGLVVRIELTP
ncbi:PAS domain-containing protein [uncultured Jannaschia sp.]|uniref:PAS domain-containing protein n=1 Tax=uncultured Jannaschia sp. TaxID=293347 RepID=UPI002623C56F|nr:PAS domain-containing protein [uncultured Jannaschia sp.]